MCTRVRLVTTTINPSESLPQFHSWNVGDNLSHLPGIVTAQLINFAREPTRVQRVQHRLDRREGALTFKDNEIVPFLSDRYETETERISGNPNRDTRIGRAGGNSRGYFQMTWKFALVPIKAIGPQREFL